MLRAPVLISTVTAMPEQLHDLAGRVAKADNAKARGDIAGQLFLPAALHLRLDSHRFERLNGSNALDQECLTFGAARKFLIQALPE